jgi:hypothetical protein
MGVQLLAALRAMFAKNRTQITSEQVVHELLADPDSHWHEYRSRGPITKNQVAALLKDFEIRPVVRSSDQASGCLATRLQGGAIRGRLCAFLLFREIDVFQGVVKQLIELLRFFGHPLSPFL